MSEEISTIQSYPLDQVKSLVIGMERVDCPVTHRFSPGIYIREIFMPAGSFIIGERHSSRHENVIRQGKAALMIAGKNQIIDSTFTFESMEGARKVLYILEDMRFMTIHAISPVLHVLAEGSEEDRKKLVEHLESVLIDSDRDEFEELETLNDLNVLMEEYSQ
jgi:hypothetical protein